MKKDIHSFIEEITNNFSELFIETFMIRYLSDYSKEELLENIDRTKTELKKKIDKGFKNKLNEFGIEALSINTNKKEE